MDLTQCLGMGTCLVASTLTPLGLVLQKHAHKQNQLKRASIAVYYQPWWIAGISVFLCGHILNIISAGLAPQAILSCLGSWAIIPNAIFAWCVLGEKLCAPQLLYMGVMVVVMMLVVLATPSASSREQGDISADMLAAMFFERAFVLLMWVVAIALAALRAVMPHDQRGHGANFRAAFWVLVATTLSGFTTVLCKCVSLLALHADPQIYLVSPNFYIMIFAAVLLSIVMLRSINTGLQEGDALVVVPMYYSLGMLFQIVVAGVFFDEFDAFSGTGQALVFSSGVSVLLLCIGALPFAQASLSQAELGSKRETEEELLAVHG